MGIGNKSLERLVVAINTQVVRVTSIIDINDFFILSFANSFSFLPVMVLVEAVHWGHVYCTYNLCDWYGCNEFFFSCFIGLAVIPLTKGSTSTFQAPYEKQLCQLNGRKLMSLFARLLWVYKPVAAALKIIWLVQ